jgi:ABC-type Fe3+ transport system permease subunit
MAFVVGPLLSGYSPFAQDLTRAYTGPSKEFWFGTDNFGRDMWTRVWEGTRVSLYIALLAALLDLFVGVPFGAVSGFMGGRVDGVMQRTIEILNGIPNLVVAILAMVIFEPGIITISIAIGLTGWTYMARIVRARCCSSRTWSSPSPRVPWGWQVQARVETPHPQLPRAHHLRDVHHTRSHLRRVVPQLYRARHPDTKRLARVPDQ